MMRLRKNKKAQVYLVFVAIFTVIALTYALVSLSKAKEIKDANGEDVLIGTKQTEIFASLQDADAVNLFLQKTAELSASKALESVQTSCMINLGTEQLEDKWKSECGKFVYPQWSNSQQLCFPNCQQAFIDAFAQDLSVRLNYYTRQTGVPIPKIYDFNISLFDNYFVLQGISSVSADFKVLDLSERTQTAISAEQPYLSAEAEPEPVENPGDNPDFGLLMWPVDTSSKILTSCFGQRIVSGGSANHPGVDIAGVNDNPVLAAAAGKVEMTDPACWGRVIINHGNDLKTEYLHMSKIIVKVGEEVKKGQQIGAVGGSGRNSKACGGVDEKTGKGKCCDNAYPKHLHFGVMYETVKQGIKYDKKFTLTDSENNKKVDYPYQELEIDGIFPNYISPLCFLAKDSYTKKTTTNEECFTPANVELDNVCKIYGLPDFSGAYAEASSGVQTGVSTTSTGSVVAEKKDASQVTSITGAAGYETPNASTTAQGGLSLSTDFGTYSFLPAFTVKVNKKIDDPIKPLTDWFENTWDACQDDPQKCINSKMKEFNDNANNIFTLSFADQCENYPVFYDFMESLEDCFSNKAFKCSCKFNFTNAFSRKDLRIVFDTDTNKATLYVKEGDSLKSLADYTFYYGKIKPTLSTQRYYAYMLNFDEKTGALTDATLTPFKEGETPGLDTYSFKDYKTVRIAKTSLEEGQFIEADSFVKCVYSKDKFRLCAKPRSKEQSDIFPIKFALQAKDKPPQPIKQGDVKIIETDQSSSSDINKLFSLLGIIYPQLGFMFNYLQILQALDNSKPRSLQVIVNIPTGKDGKPLDVAGYEVYCNDYLTNMLPKDYTEKYNPANFVVMATQQDNTKTSQLDKYVNTNTYSDFIDTNECNVPVTKPGGETVQVPGIKGAVQDNKMTFNINNCGEFAIIADKILKKNYCITLIPVDKNGNKLNDNAISNCAQTNSLMDLAIDEMIKRQLGSFIPTDIVPKDMQPYIKLPGTNEIVDAMTGKRDFDFVEIVNKDKLPSDLKLIAGGLILSTVNKDIIGSSFVNSVDNLNVWEKQTVLNTLSSQIKNEDANIIFNNFVAGNNVNDAVKQRTIAKGADYIDKSKAPEVLKEVAKGEDAESLAYQELISAASNQLSSEDKKQELIEIANSGNAETIKDKVVEKAVEKGCSENYGISVEQAAACLRNDEIDDIYYDALTSIETPNNAKQILLNRAVDKMGDNAPAVLQTVAAHQDFQGAAQQMLANELDKLPESDKRRFVSDVLEGRMTDSSDIQSEMIKMIPSVNNDYITTLMKNGNIKSLIETNLRAELEKQVNAFVSGKCAKTK